MRSRLLRDPQPMFAGIHIYHSLIAAWVISMIAVPIVGWLGGEAGLRAGVITSVIFHMSAVLACLYGAWAFRRATYVAFAIVIGAWVIEYVGSTTGLPFGQYHYTELLQPQLAGVPLVVPMAWLMMLPPAWAIATAINGKGTGLRFVLISALAFTAWDLFLDPQMVAWRYWEWDEPGGYYGIPWLNFVGWFVSAGLLTAVIRPQRVPLGPLISVYAITWVLQTIGQLVFWGMPGPALMGFLGMGTFLLLAWRNVARSKATGLKCL